MREIEFRAWDKKAKVMVIILGEQRSIQKVRRFMQEIFLIAHLKISFM